MRWSTATTTSAWGRSRRRFLFGDLDLVAQGVLYALAFTALALVGRQAGPGAYYWASLGAAALLVGWQFLVARYRDCDACFRAFLHNHWVGLAVFLGIVADYVLR